MEAEIKQTKKKLRFLGNDIMHTGIGLPAHNQACMRRQDYAYRSPYPRKQRNVKTEHKQKT